MHEGRSSQGGGLPAHLFAGSIEHSTSRLKILRATVPTLQVRVPKVGILGCQTQHPLTTGANHDWRSDRTRSPGPQFTLSRLVVGPIKIDTAFAE